MVDVIVAKPSLDTEISVIDRRVKRRGDLENEIVFDVELQIASHSAVRAGGGDDFIFHNSLGIKFHFSNHKDTSKTEQPGGRVAAKRRIETTCYRANSDYRDPLHTAGLDTAPAVGAGVCPVTNTRDYSTSDLF
jgi:hypothetical protein